MDINGVTYEMTDENLVREDPGSTSHMSEASLLEAVSNGHIQVIETRGNKDSQSAILTSNTSDILQGPIEIVDWQVAGKEAGRPKYVTGGSNITEMETIQYVYTCKYCDKSSSSLDELEDHIAKDHDQDTETTIASSKDGQGMLTIAPNISPSSASSQVDTQNEVAVLSVLSNSCYKCPFCTKMFAIEWRDSLEQHIQETHPGRVYKMPVVQKLQNQEKRFSCFLCDKVFFWQNSLTRHVKEVHQDATTADHEKFSELYGISAKKLAEKDEPRYSCMLCDKAFKWPKSLKSHMIEYHSLTASKKILEKKDKYFKCLYCDLATKYACSIRKHIERKHQDMIENMDVRKLEIPKVKAEEVKTEVISLDTRPPEIRLSGCSKVYRCPFCTYATQLPSNLVRHLTSRNHNGIFTHDELKEIKVRSFMVVKEAGSNRLPPLRFNEELKEMVNKKKLQIGVSVTEDVAESVIADIFDDEKQEMCDIDGDKEDDYETTKDNTVKQSNDEFIHIDGTMGADNDDESIRTSVNKAIDATSKSDEVTVADSHIEHMAEDTDQNMEMEERTPDTTRKIIVFDESDETERETVSCSICKKLFNDIKTFLQHVAAHENVKVAFACDVCQEEFAFYSKLKDHAELNHADIVESLSPLNTVVLSTVKSSPRKPVTTYECPFCEMLFSQMSPLQQHITLDHEKHVNSVQISLTGKSVVRQYNCFFCELAFVSLTGLVHHMQIIHPNVEKPGDVDSWIDTPSRKSSRKRKLPKWLEKDMDVGEEVPAKRKKLAEMPIRISNMTPKPPSVKVSKGTKADPVEKEKTDAVKSTQTPNQQKSKNVKSPVKRVKMISVQARGKSGSMAKKRSEATKNSDKTFKSPTVTDTSGKTNTPAPKSTPRRKKVPLIDQLASPILSEHKCPHCKFTAKRSTALTFHINFHHQNIKTEPIDPDFDTGPYGNHQTQPPQIIIEESIGVMNQGAQANPIEIEASKGANTVMVTNQNQGSSVMYLYKDVGTEAEQIAEDGTMFEDEYLATALGSEHVMNIHRCSYCNQTFPTEKAVRTHLRYNHRHVKDEEKSLSVILGCESAFKCTVCPVFSNSLDMLLLHIEVSHPLDIDVNTKDIQQVDLMTADMAVKYLCPYCPFKSKWKLSIPRHVEKYHPAAEGYKQDEIACQPELPNNTFLCPYCLGIMNSRAEVIKHASEQHKSQSGLTEADIENVEEQEETEGLMKCPYCETHSKHKSNIERHVSRVHPENIDDSGTIELKDMHNGTKVYRCQHCALESRYLTSFQHHMARQHPEIQFEPDQLSQRTAADEAVYYKCKYCNGLFKSKGAVIVHAKQSHKGKPGIKENEILVIRSDSQSTDNRVFYRCPICSEENKSQKKLLDHMREIHGEVMDFDSSDPIAILKPSNSSQTLYVCKLCKQGNSSLSSLVQHCRIMHGADKKPAFTVLKLNSDEELVNVYNCPSCTYTSLWRRTVLRHVKAVHPEQVTLTTGDIKCSLKPLNKIPSTSSTNYMCPYCDVSYKWRKSVVRHIKTYHPGFPDNVEIKSSNESGSRKGTKLLQCKRCENQTFKTIPSLQRHFQLHHPQHVNNCLNPKNLQYIYTSLPAGLGSTEGGSEDVKEQFQCVICGAMYLWKKSLYVHVKTNHPQHGEVYQVLDKMVDLIVDSIGKSIIDLDYIIWILTWKQ